MEKSSENNKKFLLLLDILSKFIFLKNGSEFISDIDTDTLELICHEADDNHLGTLLYFYCIKAKTIPDSWQAKWSTKFITNSAGELRQANELTRILKLLADNKIEASPLKGACLAYKYYPHPALRGMSDFDILVKPENVKKAFQLMLDNGFVSDYKAGCQQHKHHEPKLSSKNGYVVELHTHITPNSVRCDYDALWENCQKSKLNGQAVTFLSPEIYLLHSIDHAFRDRLIGGLKSFIDIAYILAGSNTNIKKLTACAKKTGFYNEFIIFMNIFPNFFPAKYIPASEQIPVDLIENSRYLIYNVTVARNLDIYQVMLHREYAKLTSIEKLLFIIKKMKVTPRYIAEKHECKPYSLMMIFYYFHRAWKYFIKLILFRKRSINESLHERVGTYQKQIHSLAIHNKN